MIVDQIASSKVQETKGSPWSDEELVAAINAYKHMLACQEADQSYNKSSINAGLRDGVLKERSKSSIEFRMQNISAVFASQNKAWVKGYPPALNVGKHIKARIDALLTSSEDFEPTHDNNTLIVRTRKALAAKTLSRPDGKKAPKRFSVTTVVFERCPLVRAHVLKRASGKCERCGIDAPFVDEAGIPFLEVHHITPLSEDGPDVVENTVALCPNCHRFCHHGLGRLEARHILLESILTI